MPSPVSYNYTHYITFIAILTNCGEWCASGSLDVHYLLLFVAYQSVVDLIIKHGLKRQRYSNNFIVNY